MLLVFVTNKLNILCKFFKSQLSDFQNSSLKSSSLSEFKLCCYKKAFLFYFKVGSIYLADITSVLLVYNNFNWEVRLIKSLINYSWSISPSPFESTSLNIFSISYSDC